MRKQVFELAAGGKKTSQGVLTVWVVVQVQVWASNFKDAHTYIVRNRLLYFWTCEKMGIDTFPYCFIVGWRRTNVIKVRKQNSEISLHKYYKKISLKLLKNATTFYVVFIFKTLVALILLFLWLKNIMFVNGFYFKELKKIFKISFKIGSGHKLLQFFSHLEFGAHSKECRDPIQILNKNNF